MVPQKKKVVHRKRVLDLESPNDSTTQPSRSSWQAKYKELLPADSPKSRNGTPDRISLTSGGLVNDYDSSSNSDSESSREPIGKPAEKTVVEPAAAACAPQTTRDANGAQNQVPGSTWIECFDRNSGFPYYWNQLTNQVTWQPPTEYSAVQMLRKQQTLKGSLVSAPALEKKDSVTPVVAHQGKKYPWDGNSDSEEGEDNKVPSGNDSDSQSKPCALEQTKMQQKKTSNASGSRLPATSDDNPDVYETSSLMTPLVPDTGPPGAEPPATNGSLETAVDSEGNKGRGIKQLSSDLELADKILAEIEKEVPPDFVKTLARRLSTETKASTSFALIASYGDDSDQEETSESPPKPPCLFPSVPHTSSPPKALFPSAVETPVPVPVEIKPVVAVVNMEAPRRELLVSNSPPAVLDPNLPDFTTTFRRKRRIEFAPTARTEIVPKIEIVSRPPELDYPPVTEPNTRYNMEPGERRGFGFSQLEQKIPAEKKGASIQFIKAESFLFQSSMDTSKKEASSIPAQDLVDGAALLKEKLTFLGEGKEEVSAVQQMAIQLETLVSAWQSGALTPAYLSQWLGSRAVELSKNEQAAAPPGWTCEWERDAKRYCYRNTATGALLWDYPDNEQRKASVDSMQDEVEMELSNTPPRLSPNALDTCTDLQPPPPPDISRCSTPPPPAAVAPVISKSRGVKKFVTEAISSSEDVRNIPPPPPPPVENYPLPPPPPPEPDQPPPPGVDSSNKANKTSQPPLPRNPPSESSSSSSSTSENRKRCLTSELDSFYLDLAKLSNDDSIAADDNEQPKPAAAAAATAVSEPLKNTGGALKTPRPPLPPDSPVGKSPKYSSPPPQSNSNQEISSRKRKKGKLTPGLTLKKKGVSSLVAKWQQVQEDAKKDYSSDEDMDDVTTTHTRN